MKPNMTVGLAVLAGIALFETALIPGVVIGAAAVLAPKYLPKRLHLPRLFNGKAPQRKKSEVSLPSPASVKTTLSAPALISASKPATPSALISTPTGLAAQQALVKTITFRVIVTTLDFGANYLVIGELATAAGLSAFSLAAGPFFYFVHEIAWNKYGSETPADASALEVRRPDTRIVLPRLGGFTISRALAKTITYRTIATTMDFTTNYVAVGDLATAAGLSAFGFVLGPFIYLGHEIAWDRYGWMSDRTLDQSVPGSLN